LDSRIAAARAAAPVIAELVDPALRSGYTRSLAEWVSLDVSEVSNIVSQQGRQGRSDNVAQLRTSAAETVAVQAGPQQRLERQILEILVQRPQSFNPAQLRRITAAGLTSSEHQQVLAAASSISDQLASPDFANQLSLLVSNELVGMIRELALAPLPVRNDLELGKYSAGIVRGALMQALGREKTDLLAALRRIDSSVNPEQVSQIQQQLVELETERRALM
jgi:DNA primase